MMYRNKREYGQAVKNLENALQEGAKKARHISETDTQEKTVDNSQDSG